MVGRPARRLIVLGVFVVLLAYGVLNLRSSKAPAGPQGNNPTAFAVVDAASACRAWSGIDPIIDQAVQANDPTVLYRLETTGGPQGEYAPLMRWAELADAQGQSVVLSTDLTRIQTEISSAASDSEPLSDLPVPATAVVDQCQAPAPLGGAGPAIPS